MDCDPGFANSYRHSLADAGDGQSTGLFFYRVFRGDPRCIGTPEMARRRLPDINNGKSYRTY